MTRIQCPVCIGKTLARGINDLQTMNPELSSEWNYDLNKDSKPNDIKAVSTQKVWWICSKCGYEWKESPNNRRRNGRGRCPACQNSVVLAGYNDLATANSRLAAEWHPIKNGSLLPSQVTAVTGKKAWWTCSRGHEWEATIASRNAGNNCPFCANKLVLTGFNDLATVNPVVAAEWHPTENGDLSPQLVLSGSGKKVWWLGKCGHEWEAKISDRALRGYACPLCRKSRPKSHEEFCRAISELNPNIEIIGTYEKSHKKISVRCKKCGYEWETKPNTAPISSEKYISLIDGWNNEAERNYLLCTQVGCSERGDAERIINALIGSVSNLAVSGEQISLGWETDTSAWFSSRPVPSLKRNSLFAELLYRIVYRDSLNIGICRNCGAPFLQNGIGSLNDVCSQACRMAQRRRKGLA